MNLSAIFHRPTLDYIYPSKRNELIVKLFLASDNYKKVEIAWWFREKNNIDCIKKVAASKTFSDGYHDLYECNLNTNELSAYVRYYFIIDDGKETISYGPEGFSNKEPLFNDNYFEFLWPNISDGEMSPSWSYNQIYYQIFPERFMNSNPSLNPKDVVSWGSKPTKDNFMGGDLQGIINKLDYIKDLGATCLYLTPIFKATSNHKYDTVDYYDIDPSFGSKEDLKKLVSSAHNKGLRIILDGVFNHCGYYSQFFQDVVKNGINSKYSNWFFIHNYPVSLDKMNYDCVGHYKWMPKLNLDNPETAEYFINVGEYWIKEYDIDGWRLDVADEISTSFWQVFADRIKKLKHDAILLGETWGDANKLLINDRLDSAMNYLFKNAAVKWLAHSNIKPSQFNYLLNYMFSLYRKEAIYRLYNPLDSHDTKRFLRECHDDINKFKLAIALQMTIPGCPAIFYGDEVGLTGENDPDCRLCMEWDENKQNKDIYNWYKKLIGIRKENKSLVLGDFKNAFLDDEKNVYAYFRKTDDETTLIIINAGNTCFDTSSYINLKKYDEIILDRYITDNPDTNSAFVSANSVHIYKRKES